MKATHVRFRRWVEKAAIIFQRLFKQMCGQMAELKLAEVCGNIL
jgi:hypothetical protein